MIPTLVIRIIVYSPAKDETQAKPSREGTRPRYTNRSRSATTTPKANATGTVAAQNNRKINTNNNTNNIRTTLRCLKGVRGMLKPHFVFRFRQLFLHALTTINSAKDSQDLVFGPS